MRLILGICFFFISCQLALAQKDQGNLLQIEALQEDFQLLVNSLKEIHPALHWYTSVSSFDSLKNTILEKINRPMDAMEFTKLLSPLIERVNCGHTNLLLPKSTIKKFRKEEVKLLPFFTKFIDKRAFVNFLINQDSTIKIGWEILKINDQPLTEIVDELQQFITTDGYNESMKYAALDNAIFRYYYGLRIAQPDSFRIEFRTLQDSTINLTMAAHTVV